MRSWRLSILALILAATAACHDSKGPKEAKPPPKPTASATELVSIAWTPANADQNLQSFELQLTGADTVSICRKPPGWILEGSGASWGMVPLPAGFLEGLRAVTKETAG
jgi:hypothetical protein